MFKVFKVRKMIALGVGMAMSLSRVERLGNSLSMLFTLCILCIPVSAQAVPYELIETATPSGGQYTVYNNSESQYVLAIVVENSSSISAGTTREGWGASVCSKANWNGGGCGYAYSSSGGPVEYLSMSLLPSFESFFGPDATQANVYWFGDEFEGTRISPGEIDTRFTWFGGGPESHFIVFGEGLNNILYEADAISATPLPAALPLFGTGLGVMGLIGWRRKQKKAAAVA